MTADLSFVWISRLDIPALVDACLLAGGLLELQDQFSNRWGEGRARLVGKTCALLSIEEIPIANSTGNP
jgi:hypothetical protein